MAEPVGHSCTQEPRGSRHVWKMCEKQWKVMKIDKIGMTLPVKNQEVLLSSSIFPWAPVHRNDLEEYLTGRMSHSVPCFWRKLSLLLNDHIWAYKITFYLFLIIVLSTYVHFSLSPNLKIFLMRCMESMTSLWSVKSNVWQHAAAAAYVVYPTLK